MGLGRGLEIVVFRRGHGFITPFITLRTFGIWGHFLVVSGRPSGPASAHGPSVALTGQRRRVQVTGRPSGCCPSSLARRQGAFSSSLPPPHFPPSPSRRWAPPWNMYSTSSLVTSAYRMAVTSSRQPSPTLAPA